MTLWLLALLTFGAGASLIRLLTKDSLFEGLRDRWVTHFDAAREDVLAEIEARHPIRAVAQEKYLRGWAERGQPRREDQLTRQERAMAMLEEIGDRSEAERPAPWYLIGAARRSRRPWSEYSAKLIRIRGYAEFISCPWCVGFWVFLGVWAVSWAVALDSPAEVWGLPFWLALPAVALAYRWVYAVLATHLDNR